MTKTQPRERRLRRSSGFAPRTAPHGFTLVETAVSTLLVGFLLVASMQTVGSVARIRNLSYDRATARLLADQLATEIQGMNYQEPAGTPAFGAESGESGNRTLFDDIDDYHNYSETPPRFRDGTALPIGAGWSREVIVQETLLTDSLLTADLTILGIPIGVGLKTGDASGTGIRKVTVNVRKNGALLATSQVLRTKSW